MRNSITKLVSIAFLGGLIGRGLRYGFNIIIARGLGFEALGVFAFGTVVMKGGAVLSRVGLDSAAQKYIPIYRTKNDSAKVSGTVLLCLAVPLLFGGLLAVSLYLSQGLIAEFTGMALSSTTQLFFAGIPLYAAMMVGVKATYGLKETKYSVYIRDFGQSVVAVVFMMIGAFVFTELNIVVIGYLGSILAGICLATIFLIREGALRFDVQPIFEWREIFAFSLPLTLAASIQYLVSWTDIVVLGVFVSSEAVGRYQAVFQTSALLVVVLRAMNSIFPPIAADLYDSGQQERLNRVYTAVTRWVTYFTILGFAFVVVYANDILSIFGETGQSARAALVVLALGQTLNAIVGPTGFLLIMSEHERFQLVNNIVAAVANLILNVVLIQMYGIIGAAAATGTSLALMNMLRLIEVRYLLGIQPYSWQYWKGLAAVGCALPVMVLARNLPLAGPVRVVLVGTGAFTVFAAVIWLFGFDDVDRALLESVGD